MKCERCLNGEEARYRVYTDAIDMKVCPPCAEEAREVGIKIELLGGEKKEPIAKGNTHSATEVETGGADRFEKTQLLGRAQK